MHAFAQDDRTQPLAERIAALPPGEFLGTRTMVAYSLVAHRGNAYVVECGWLVAEEDADNLEGDTYNPLGCDTMRPWVGRRRVCYFPDEAGTAYLSYKEAAEHQRMPRTGERIGSVVR